METLEDMMARLRAELKRIGKDLDNLRRENLTPENEAADVGEIKANATLAYRHIEDARMRLGKVIQANDGGVSVYDR